jgi:hypothetical protein
MYRVSKAWTGWFCGILMEVKVESQLHATVCRGVVVLTGEFLGRMPKLATVQKTLVVKLSPPLEVFVQLVVKVDFISGSVDDQVDLAQLTLEARYARLLELLRKQNEARLEAVSSSAGVVNGPLQASVGHGLSVLEDRSLGHSSSSSLTELRPNHPFDFAVLWEGRDAGTISNVHVRVGASVSFGTPLFDVVTESCYNPDEIYRTLYGVNKSPDPRMSSLYDQMQNPKSECAGITVNYVEKVDGIVKELLMVVGARVEPQELVVLVEQGVDKGMLRENVNKSNEEFQVLVESLAQSVANGVLQSNCLDMCKKLHGVIHNFTETARTYGRVIISELHLPVSEKTIKPSSLGGVLGGSKYVVRNVLFKTPSANGFSSYPDPWLISHKIQGHELKGCNAYFSYFFNGGVSGIVSFPLMAVIDYKGHRITAMAQLPVDGDTTLIYGCSNAGENCDVMNKNSAWSQFVRDASVNGLNLAPHYVVNNRRAGGEIEIASCIDLEGHAGFDNRFYLLDFSRTFPAAFKNQPKPYDTFWHCYHLLRQEFVYNWGRDHAQISADAFSCFQMTLTAERKDQSKTANENAIAAEKYLTTSVVSSVAQELLRAKSESDFISVRSVFHSHGLNMRYIGLVYRKLVSSEFYSGDHYWLYSSIQLEALVRAAKISLRKKLRDVAKEAINGYENNALQLSIVVGFLNSFFRTSGSLQSWIDRHPFVLDDLVDHFSFTQRHARNAVEALRIVDTTVQSSSFKLTLIARLSHVAGIVFVSRALDDLRSGKRSFDHLSLFEESEVRFVERLKMLDISERVVALSCYLRGLETKVAPLAAPLEKESSAPKVSSMSLASEKFEEAFVVLSEALSAHPQDEFFRALMGEICSQLWQCCSGDKDKKAGNKYKTMAEGKFVHLLEEKKATIFVYRCYGAFLLECNRLHDAEDVLLRGLEQCERLSLPLDVDALVELETVLQRKGTTDAEDLASELREVANQMVKFRESQPPILEMEQDNSKKKRILDVLKSKKLGFVGTLVSAAAANRPRLLKKEGGINELLNSQESVRTSQESVRMQKSSPGLLSRSSHSTSLSRSSQGTSIIEGEISGWLVKKKGNSHGNFTSAKKRFCFVDNKHLLYCEKKGALEKGSISLFGCEVSLSIEDKSILLLKTVENSLHSFQMVNGGSMEAWFHIISKIAKEIHADSSLSGHLQGLSGYLNKKKAKGGGTWTLAKKRWCVLQGKTLFYFEQKGALELGTLDLSSSFQVSLKDSGFVLKTGESVHWFGAAEGTTSAFVNELYDAIVELLTVIVPRPRQSRSSQTLSISPPASPNRSQASSPRFDDDPFGSPRHELEQSPHSPNPKTSAVRSQNKRGALVMAKNASLGFDE